MHHVQIDPTYTSIILWTRACTYPGPAYISVRTHRNEKRVTSNEQFLLMLNISMLYSELRMFVFFSCRKILNKIHKNCCN